MDIVYIDKCRYEIQEQNEVPVYHTGQFLSLLHTGISLHFPVVFVVYFHIDWFGHW
jgi:hypothetical protein